MANRQEILVSQKGAQKTSRELGNVDKGLNGIAKGAIAAASAIGALAVAQKGIELTKLAADAVNVERAFRNLSKEPDRMLKAMKKAVGGTIEEFELMKQFNQAALLGLPLERFDEMISIARGAALATGQSMDFMLNSIVTGIGRQSKLMIDNLGILVSIGDANEVYAKQLGKQASALTDLEQKTAFANAVLDAGAKNIEKMGGEAEGAFDGVNKLTSIIKDSTIDAFKNLVSPIDTAAGALADFMTISEQGALTQEERNTKLMKDEFHGAMLRLKIRDNLMAKWKEEQEIQKEAIELDLSTQTSLRATNIEYQNMAQLIASVKQETVGLMEVQHEQVALLPEIALEANDLSNVYSDAVVPAMDSYVDSMVWAIVHGQSMKDSLIASSKALTVQLISDFVKRKIASTLFVEATTAETVLAAQVVGAAWATPAALAATATAGASAVSGGLALAATVAEANAIAAYASGADFVTNGPQLIMVGDNSTGREHVSVTPLGGGDSSGGGVTINIMGDFIGNQDFVESTLIPAINLASQQGRASIA